MKKRSCFILRRTVVLLFSGVLMGNTILSCRQVPDHGTDRLIVSEAGMAEFQPDDPTILPPSPASGDTILTDPPGFNWPQDKEDAGFILEISRSSSFPASDSLLKKASKGGNLVPASLTETVRIYSADNSYLITGLPLPLHRPSFALGEGNWYWRRRSVTIDGTVSLPSPPLQFRVSEKSIDYPVPPVKELLNRIPDKHPRLFIRPENLDSLQSLLNISEPHRDLYARISKYADTLLLLPINQEPGPVPREGENWYHIWRDYYDQARKSGQVLDFLSFCYMMTGEEKYAERARQWLLTFVQWDPEGNSSMAANDEVAMPILLNGARAYDWLYDYLSEEERSAIKKMLVIRGEQAFSVWQSRDYHYRPYISHPTRLVSYMTQVGTILYGEAPEAEKWLSYLIPIVTTFYPAWGGSDGGYSEGPSYWLMYFNYMLQSAHCIQSAMDLDILKKDFYRNSGWYKIYAYPYYAAMRPFGDTGIGHYWTANKMNLYRLATIYNNSYFRWRADMSKPDKMPVAETMIPTGIMSFFWLNEGPDAVQPTPPENLPGSRLFQDIGLVAFHEDPGNPDETYFLLKSSPYGAWSHAYADQNSFYIQGFGEALAIQSGYYPHYGHPHHKEWTWETDAHNSVLVNGLGQKIRDRGSRGEIIEFRRGNGEPGSVDYAAGDATAAYSGRLDKFIRHVYYTRPRDFLIIDELEAPEPVRYDWLLHSLEKMEIDQKNRELTIRKGEAMLVVQFISPENLKFSQTNKFSVEPGLSYPEGFAYPDQWHLTVSTTKKTEAATFIVKMKVRSTED